MVKILDMQKEEVVQAVRDGKVTMCVVGLGYVGLPLGVLFAKEGARVIGCVRTEESAQRINKSETRIVEHDVSTLLRMGATISDSTCPNCGVQLFKWEKETFCPSCGRLASITKFGVYLRDAIATAHERIIQSRQTLAELLQNVIQTGRFYATTETSKAVSKSDVILIAVGTPVDEKNVPNYGDLKNAASAVGDGLRKGSLVILKSTVSPGTTENVVKPLLEKESLQAGRDFALAFMPEMIKEGHALHEFRTLPRIVGGFTRRCARAAANVFSVFPAPVYVCGSPSVAEAAKLFQNIYRDVNIALVNELALVCEKLGVDVIQAISAANVDPKTHLLTPGLVGGYCLPKDTYHLAYPAENAGYSSRLITLARRLNNAMPEHILELVDDAFREMNVSIEGARVSVLGLGFKANSGDLRNTPAEPIIRGLLERGALVVAHDPFARFEEVSRILPKMAYTRNLEEAIRGSKCAVIVTDHLEYRGLTARYFGELMPKPCAIVDARHIIDPEEASASKVVFRGYGKPRVKAE